MEIHKPKCKYTINENEVPTHPIFILTFSTAYADKDRKNDLGVAVVAVVALVHYCTLSLSNIWVTRQIIITNSKWSIQRLSRWVMV